MSMQLSPHIMAQIFEETTDAERERHANRIVGLPNFLTANPLLILGLTPSATFDECKQTYRRLSYLFHPDKLAFSHISENLHYTLNAAFPGRNPFEEVFKLLHLLQDPKNLSIYSHQLSEASRKRKAPRKVARNRPSKLFADHDTQLYQSFSNSCSSLLQAIGRGSQSKDIISQLKATVQQAKIVPRSDFPKTVEEVLQSNPGIALLNEKVKGTVLPPVARAAALIQANTCTPRSASYSHLIAHSGSDDEAHIECIVLEDGTQVSDCPSEVFSKRKASQVEFEFKSSAPKRRKLSADDPSPVQPASQQMTYSAFSELLESLPAGLQRPLI